MDFCDLLSTEINYMKNSASPTSMLHTEIKNNQGEVIPVMVKMFMDIGFLNQGLANIVDWTKVAIASISYDNMKMFQHCLSFPLYLEPIIKLASASADQGYLEILLKYYGTSINIEEVVQNIESENKTIAVIQNMNLDWRSLALSSYQHKYINLCIFAIQKLEKQEFPMSLNDLAVDDYKLDSEGYVILNKNPVEKLNRLFEEAEITGHNDTLLKNLIQPIVDSYAEEIVSAACYFGNKEVLEFLIKERDLYDKVSKFYLLAELTKNRRGKLFENYYPESKLTEEQNMYLFVKAAEYGSCDIMAEVSYSGIYDNDAAFYAAMEKNRFNTAKYILDPAFYISDNPEEDSSEEDSAEEEDNPEQVSPSYF